MGHFWATFYSIIWSRCFLTKQAYLNNCNFLGYFERHKFFNNNNYGENGQLLCRLDYFLF